MFEFDFFCVRLNFFVLHRFLYHNAYSRRLKTFPATLYALPYRSRCELEIAIAGRSLMEDKNMILRFFSGIMFMFCIVLHLIMLTKDVSKYFLLNWKHFHTVVGEKQNIQLETKYFIRAINIIMNFRLVLKYLYCVDFRLVMLPWN